MLEHRFSNQKPGLICCHRDLNTLKNLFDLRRTAVVYNLHVLARMLVDKQEFLELPTQA